MGFKFASFGAATVPLSKVIIDKNLEMGEYTIIADEIRVERVYSPIDTEDWPTEELEWGDIEDIEDDTTQTSPLIFPQAGAEHELIPAESTEKRVTIRLYNHGWAIKDVTLKIGGTTVETRGEVGYDQWYTFAEHVVPAGENVSVYAYGLRDDSSATFYITFVGQKTIDLTGKWLALGLDMHGLDATVKIQGVEVPYSDYAKYFPLAPTELTIPGGWTSLEERPVIKVYK